LAAAAAVSVLELMIAPQLQFSPSLFSVLDSAVANKIF